jgi:transcriptional regulator with XRE-family HTH domain
MTQEQLATASHTGLRTIRDIETGRVVRPRSSTVRLLADAFELRGPERDRFYRSALVEGDGRRAAPSAGSIGDDAGTAAPPTAPPGTGRHTPVHRS